MMIEAIEGIVVKEKTYGESSKILDVYTPNYGIISVLSKGCKKIKSSLRAGSNLLIYGIFHLRYKPDKLSTVTAIDVKSYFKEIKQDIKKISYATYLLELSSNVEKQAKTKEIYFILKNALLKMEQSFDAEALTQIVEFKYLSYLGVMPNVEACNLCGNQTEILTIVPSKGGFICKECYQNEKLYSPKTLKLLRIFSILDLAKIDKLEIPLQEKKEISELLDEYYEDYTGLYLKSRSFLKKLIKFQ